MEGPLGRHLRGLPASSWASTAFFYDMVGMEVTGLDGFYPDVFPVYGDYGIRILKIPRAFVMRSSKRPACAR